MTNTKFRKRALLSSVAMLLVALVALGSATFAWFSTSNTANASSMLAKTTKSSNLLIRESFAQNSQTWTQNLTLVATTLTTDSLTPVTTADFSTWKSAKADTYDGVLAGTGANALDTVTFGTTYGSSTTIYAKYGNEVAQGETAGTKSLKVTINGLATDNDSKDYIRVAFVPMATTVDNVTATTSTVKVYGNAKDDWAKDVTNAAKTAPADDTKSIVTDVSTTITLGTITEGEVYGYNVYAYFEGTDIHCKDSMSGASTGAFTFTFSAE